MLVWFSVHLASWRIYQVDECCNLVGARFIATGEAKSVNGVSFFQFILSWLYRSTPRAPDLFVSARFVMVEIFWLNVVLIAMAAGGRLCSVGGILALVGAATLAPLWDYGLEVRHDNLMLTGLLLIWCVIRVRPVGLQSYAIAGAVAVGLQFIAFKAFVYTVPVSLAILAFPPPSFAFPRWKLGLAWLVGALGVYLAIRSVYSSLGLWGNYTSGTLEGVATASTAGVRFWPGRTLARLLSQTPLLLAIVTSGLGTLCANLWHHKKAAAGWDGLIPEAMMLGIAFGGLLINPTPFPYNLVNLVPYAFVFGFKHGLNLWNRFACQTTALQLVLPVLIFTHLVPFGIVTLRHLRWPNTRQEQLMRRAEGLTDPLKDPVYDGTGLVPTRPTISPWSFIHSLTIHRLREGPGPRVREMLATNPAPVLITSYRTDWLTEADHAFIGDHYVSLADDFWVLGTVLSVGGGAFEVIHPGRYRIAPLAASDLAGTFPEGIEGFFCPEPEETLGGTLDGMPLTNGLVELTVGYHWIECETECQPTVVWTGPKLTRPHRLSQSDHRRLFVNWY